MQIDAIDELLQCCTVWIPYDLCRPWWRSDGGPKGAVRLKHSNVVLWNLALRHEPTVDHESESIELVRASLSRLRSNTPRLQLDKIQSMKLTVLIVSGLLYPVAAFVPRDIPRGSPFTLSAVVSRRQCLEGSLLGAAALLVSTPARADVASGNALPQGAQQFARSVRLKVEVKVRRFRSLPTQTRCRKSNEDSQLLEKEKLTTKSGRIFGRS